MGIDVDNSLLVGCSYGELEDFFERVIEEGETKEHEAFDDAGEVIEHYFEYASPYYDSDIEDWFIGFTVPNLKVPDETWFNTVHEEASKFQALTGVKPRIRGGAHVW